MYSRNVDPILMLKFTEWGSVELSARFVLNAQHAVFFPITAVNSYICQDPRKKTCSVLRHIASPQ